MGTWLGSRKRSPVFQEQRFGPAGRSQQPPLSTAFLGQAAWPDPKGAVTNTAISSDSGTGHPEGWGHPRDRVTAPGHDLTLGRNLRLQPRVASYPLAAPPPLLCPCFGAHRCVGDRVGAKGSILAGEGTARSGHQAGAAGTGTLVGDEAVGPRPVGRRRWAAQGRVVGATHGQEVRCGVSGHHLPSVGEDGCGEEAEGVDPWGWGGRQGSCWAPEMPGARLLRAPVAHLGVLSPCCWDHH